MSSPYFHTCSISLISINAGKTASIIYSPQIVFPSSPRIISSFQSKTFENKPVSVPCAAQNVLKRKAILIKPLSDAQEVFDTEANV